jgi:DNA-binding winged helix-turn-helix (wHTH) protein
MGDALVGQIAFGPFRMDLEGGRLIRDGCDLELRPQAFHALRTLIQNTGKHVDYEQMIHQAWEGVSVSRHTVAVTIGEAKKVLREYGCWIHYRPRLGYRLEIPPADALIRRGWHFARLDTREGLEKALGCFQEAAVGDSADFRPYEGMAHCYLMLGAYGLRPSLEIYPKFKDALQEAVIRESLTPELQGLRGHALHIFERKTADAESDLLRAVENAPALASLRGHLFMLYAATGRFEKAEAVLADAYLADSLWPMLPTMEVLLLLCRREFDCAVACGRKAVDLHPHFPMGRFFYGYALLLAGQPSAAIGQFGIARVMSPESHCFRAHEAICWAHMGNSQEAERIVAELEDIRRTDYVDAYNLIVPNHALGRIDRAFDELERAWQENSAPLFILDVDPKMDPLRGQPRFERIRNRVFGRSAHG